MDDLDPSAVADRIVSLWERTLVPFDLAEGDMDELRRLIAEHVEHAIKCALAPKPPPTCEQCGAPGRVQRSDRWLCYAHGYADANGGDINLEVAGGGVITIRGPKT